ncbi:MAG: hypothetical protein AB1938_08670 [Myxococcota bacterium]
MRLASLVLVLVVSGCASAAGADAGSTDAGRDGGCTSGRTYLDCGCGCCGGTTPTRRCVYSSRGEDFDALVRQAEETLANTDCATAGCSLGVELVCCD